MHYDSWQRKHLGRSLPGSQEPSTGPEEPSPYPQTLFLKIILSYSPTDLTVSHPKGSHSSGFFDSSFVYTPVSPPHRPWFCHPNVWWRVRLSKSLIMHYLLSSLYFCLLGPGTVASSFFMNMLNLSSSLRLRLPYGRNKNIVTFWWFARDL
jgi:hypothetical protein